MYVDLLKAIEDYSVLKITKKQFYKIMSENPSFYIKNRGKISAAETLRHQIVKDRNLEVLYITGNSKSGKTTSAKYFAQKLNLDFFVTGTGDDILDGYDKEECIILDDFRANTFRFSELLKLLDNNTNSSVRSRYVNKDISNCRLIIITSTKKPQELYTLLQSDEDGQKEEAEQLYRRLKHRYWVIEGEEYAGDIKEKKLPKDGKDYYTGRTFGNMKDIYKELGISPGKNDNNSLFDVFAQETIDNPKLTEVTEPDEINFLDQYL